MERIVKIGPVELFESEAIQYYNDQKYIMTYSRVYQIIRKQDRIYGKEILKSKGLTRRGRFYALTEDNLPKSIREMIRK